MRKSIRYLLVAALVAAPGALSAQIPGIGLEASLRGGTYLPASDAYAAYNDASELLEMEREVGLSLGGSLELSVPLSPISVRIGADYVTGSAVTLQSLDGEVVRTEAQSEKAKMMYVSGDLVFRPLPSLIFVQPYVLGGYAYRHADFGMADVHDLRDGDGAFHAGIGVDASFGGLGIVVEVSDYIRATDVLGGGFEHDAFVSAGLKVPVL